MQLWFGACLRGVHVQCCVFREFNYKLGLLKPREEIKSWCRVNQTNVSITALNTKMLQLKGKKQYPSLMCKGADTKLLIAWTAEILFNKELPPTDETMILRATSHHLASFVYYMDVFPMFLSDAQALGFICC